MSHTLVFDIETVRDHAIWTPPADEPDLFAPPHAWRPIVIGCVLFKDEDLVPTVVRAGAIRTDRPGTDAGERELLKGFTDTVDKLAANLVTWNGRRFDLPVIMLRAMRQGIQVPWYYQGRDFRYRFSETGHCDLADAMADYGACPSLGLDGMAKLIGLPGKVGDIDGAGVEKAFADGRYSEIVDYCKADAVQTAILWLRWRLLKGDYDLATYRESTTRLLEAWGSGTVAERIDRRVLLLDGEEERGEAHE